MNLSTQLTHRHFQGKLLLHLIQSYPYLSSMNSVRGRPGEDSKTIRHLFIFHYFYKYMHIFFQEKKKKLLVESRLDFACFAEVHPLFRANSPVQHKQGLLKTFSSKTIAMTFDVFMVLALPYCLIVMFYNIFSPSSQALFQVPLLWNSWLHHPSFYIQWDTMERISRHLFWLKWLPLLPVYTASFPSAEFTDVPVARLKELSSSRTSPSFLGIPFRVLP